MTGSDLRFRAWYGGAMFFTVLDEEEGMIFVEENDLLKDATEQIWYPMGLVWADENAIIMRRTAYSDKNSKWIYEGDYIQTDTGIGIVNIDEDDLTIASGDKDSPHAYDSVRQEEWATFKVVGNIHQHEQESIYAGYGKENK